MPNLKLNSKLAPLLKKHKRFKIIIGGRGSGKSQGVADIMLLKAQTEGAKVCCFREYQISIKDSVKALLDEEIKNLELSGFESLKTEIRVQGGGEFTFKGLAINPNSVKSMQGYKYFWVEEAESTSDDSLEKLTGTMRKAGGEVWFTANPGSSEDAFSKRFINPYWGELLKHGYYEDDHIIIVMLNWRDNPWFPPGSAEEMAMDRGRLSQSEFDHKWEGHFNDSVENAIIKAEWFDACIDAHEKLGFKPMGRKILSHDPSDSGDAKGISIRHGSVILDVQENSILDVNDGMDWALRMAINERVDVFSWDCDGMGISLKRQVSQALEGKKIDTHMFRGSESPSFPKEPYMGDTGYKQRRNNEDVFRNKRAQAYWLLRDRCYNTYLAIQQKQYTDPDQLISFSSKIQHMTKFRAELCRIPKKENSGWIQIMTKKEMKDRYKIQSPNMADCVMMNMDMPKIAPRWEPLKINKTSMV